MALEKSQLPILFGGVSRQPHTARRVYQMQVHDNALPDVVTGGFEKRPATQYLATLDGLDPTADYGVHSIDRSAAEQTMVLVSTGDIKLYDSITGDQKNLVIADSTRHYLVDATGVNVVGLVEVGFVDVKVQTAFAPEETEFDWTFAASAAGIVFDIEGSADGTTFVIIATGLTGASGTLTTTIGAVAAGDHNYIRVRVTTGAGTGASTLSLSAVFQDMTYLLCANPEDFATVSVLDTFLIANRNIVTRMGPAGSGTITSTVQEFTDLPAVSGSGNIHRITGTELDGFGTFYVIDDPATSTWIETVDPNATNVFDPSSMPHKLVKNVDGSFTFSQATWAPREIGDVTVVPEPPFIGNSVNDIFFFRGRLGVLSDESVFVGRTGNSFNMWPSKASTVLDSDPVERLATTDDINILNWSAVFRKLLFVTSGRAQFELNSPEDLKPDTATFDRATTYIASPVAKPEVMGDVLFFAADAANGARLYEYSFQDVTLTNTAADITKHVTDYIPKSIIQVVSDVTSSTVFVLSSGEQNSVYIYKSFFDGAKKVQSSWGRYIFGATEGDAFIHGMAVLSGFLVLVIERQDNAVHLEQIPINRGLDDTVLGYSPLLDQRELVLGVYDSVNDCTTWETSYEHDRDLQIIHGPDVDDPGSQHSLFYTHNGFLTLSSVVAGEQITIEGVTFTAHAVTQDAAHRYFTIQGATDTVDAIKLATLINDPTYGVLTHIASVRAGGIIDIRARDACEGAAIVPTGTAIDNATASWTVNINLASTNGRWDQGLSYCGRPYTMTVELSKLYKRKSADEPVALLGTYILRDVTFHYSDSGYFKVTVTPKGRQANSREFTGMPLGSEDLVAGQAPVLTDGTFKKGVRSNGRTVKISVTNDTPWPCVITAAEMRGFYTEITEEG